MEKNKSQDYLKFYQEHEIIPTTQNTSNWKKHKRGRQALYCHLGLPPCAFQNSDILEIGPGTGQNAKVLLEWKPKSLTLVDANPASIKKTNMELKKTNISTTSVLAKIEDFRSKVKFDIVLCEGMIPALPKPDRVFQQVIKHVKPNGVVVITCMDPISLLPEMLRRWVGRMLMPESAPIRVQAEYLAKLFARDLKYLPGMTRLHQDWATDNIIRPWGTHFFPISEALELISKDRWSVQGASPHFLQDWRWHKTIAIQPHSQKVALQAYWQFAPNLLDIRLKEPSYVGAKTFRKLCQKTINSILQAEPSPIAGNIIGKQVEEIAEYYSSSSTMETQVALLEFVDFAKTGKQTVTRYKSLTNFPKLWGRGQQYLSLQKS